MRYWETVSCVHPWIQRQAIFLDNATSTNKNKFLFAWAMELVSRGVISHVRISFMIAGHTKFASDCLFATIGSAYKVADVFTIDELKSLCAPSATTIIKSGQNVFTWRDTLGEKYSDLPGVRKLHDFLFIRAHTGQVVMKVWEKCFRGQWKDSLLHIVNPMVVGTQSTNYKDKHEHNIKDDKMVGDHVRQVHLTGQVSRLFASDNATMSHFQIDIIIRNLSTGSNSLNTLFCTYKAEKVYS